MNVELVTTREHLMGIEKEWKTLLKTCKNMTVFQSFEWVKDFYDVYGGRLLVYVVRDGKILGIAPLVERDGTVEFIGTPKSDYADFIIAERHSEVLDQVFKHLSKEKWNHIHLAEVPQDSFLCKYQLKNSVKGFANQCFCMEFKNHPIEEINQKLNKRDLKRHTKGLKKHGHLSHEKAKDKDKIVKLLFKHHTEIWKAKGMPAIFEEKRQRELYLRLINEPFFILWTLNLNEEPIAIQAGFEMFHTYLSYCQAFHPYWSRFSPGNVLHKRILEHYIKKDYNAVDLSRGAERYKQRFSNKETINYNIEVFRDPFKPYMYRFHNFIKEYIMKRPKLHTWIYKWRYKLFKK